MIDTNKREEIRRQKDKVRRRIRVEVDPDNYQYISCLRSVALCMFSPPSASLDLSLRNVGAT